MAWIPRYSGDIDFLVRPSPTNAALVVGAIEQFGLASLGISVSDMDVPGKVVQIGCEPNRIDLMTSITAVAFDQAWASRSSGQLDGIEVNFIGRAELLRNTEATGRSKDLIDAIESRKQDGLKG